MTDVWANLRTTYEPGTKEYQADLKRRNGGLTPGRDDDLIASYRQAIQSGTMPPEVIDNLIQRNPAASALFNFDRWKGGVLLSARSIRSGPSIGDGINKIQSGPPDYQGQADFLSQAGLPQEASLLRKDVPSMNGDSLRPFSTFVNQDTGEVMVLTNQIKDGKPEVLGTGVNTQKFAPTTREYGGVGYTYNPNQNQLTPVIPNDQIAAGEAKVAGAKTGASEEEKLRVDRQRSRPKDRSLIRTLDRNQTSLERQVSKVRDMASGWTTGLMSTAKVVPGTPQYDLKAALMVIQSRLFVDILQEMRNNNQTGGAVGQVAVAEMERLMSNFGALDQAQSKEQFLQQLNEVAKTYGEMVDNARNYYSDTYGEPVDFLPNRSSSGGLTPAEKAELEQLRKELGQ